MNLLVRSLIVIAFVVSLASAMPGIDGSVIADEIDTATPTIETTLEATSESTVSPVETPAATEVATETPTIAPTNEPTVTATPSPMPTPNPTASPGVHTSDVQAQLTPRIGLSASSGTVGQVIRVQVDDFPADKRVAIYFDGARKTTIVTSATGRARGSFVVPATPGGVHEVKANGGGKSAYRSFSVTPNLTVNPTSLSSGGSLTLGVNGFGASSSVKIRLYDLDGSTVVSVWTGTTDSSGKTTLTVKSKLATVPGLHNVKAFGNAALVAQSQVTFLARTATIETDLLNLRATPSTTGAILAQMLHGETVKILSSIGDWVEVTYNGARGWAFGSYLKLGGDSASFWVPTHQQQHSLSCEYASLQIATSALGDEVPEDEFIPVVGSANNPHYGFRGNIDGVDIFGTDDYGVYPEALADALPVFGFEGTVFYGGTSTLKSYLRAGTPVVIWIDLGFDTSFTMIIDGEPVTMAPRSHVVVAYGFSDEGVLISDPDSSTRKRLIPWSDFNVMWSSMDQMALAVTR